MLGKPGSLGFAIGMKPKLTTNGKLGVGEDVLVLSMLSILTRR